jgi:hypothetical protein
MWLSIFYTAIPVGTAVGYSYSAGFSATVGWQFAFFVEGIIMLPFVFFLFINSHKYPCESCGSQKSNSYIDTNKASVDNEAEKVYNPMRDFSGSSRISFSPSPSPSFSSSPSSSFSSVPVVEDSVSSANEKKYSSSDDNAIPSSSSKAAPPSIWEEVKVITKRPIYLCLIIGYAAQTGALIGISTFGSAFLMGLGYFDSETTASSIFGVFISLAGVIGTPIGGFVLDDTDKRLQRTSVTDVGIGRKDSSITKANAPFRACMILITLCSIAGVFNMVLLYWVTDKWLWLFVVSVACAIIFSTNAGINMAIMMSVPQMHRSSAIAVSSLTIHLFGDVPSPIIGFLYINICIDV